MVQRASERRSDACAIHAMASDGLRSPPLCLQLRRRRLCSLLGRPERERHSYRSSLSPLSSPCSASREQSAKNSAGAGSSCHVFGRATGGCRQCGQAPVCGVCGTSPRSSSQACRSNWCRRYCFFFPWPSQECSWAWCSWRAATLCLPRWSVTCGQHHDGAQRCRRLLPCVLVDAVCRLRRSRARGYGQVTSANACDQMTALQDAMAAITAGHQLAATRVRSSRGGSAAQAPPSSGIAGGAVPSKLKAQPTS